MSQKRISGQFMESNDTSYNWLCAKALDFSRLFSDSQVSLRILTFLTDRHQLGTRRQFPILQCTTNYSYKFDINNE